MACNCSTVTERVGADPSQAQVWPGNAGDKDTPCLHGFQQTAGSVSAEQHPGPLDCHFPLQAGEGASPGASRGFPLSQRV